MATHKTWCGGGGGYEGGLGCRLVATGAGGGANGDGDDASEDEDEALCAIASQAEADAEAKPQLQQNVADLALVSQVVIMFLGTHKLYFTT